MGNPSSKFEEDLPEIENEEPISATEPISTPESIITSELDPRSPSAGIVRTPIQVTHSIRL